MLYRKAKIALGSGASLLLLAACSGGGSPTSTNVVPQVPGQGQARQASLAVRVAAPMNGKIGLPPGFRLLQNGVKESSPGWLSEDAKSSSSKLYVSDESASAVYIYNAKKPASPIGTITKGISEPIGIFTDSASNLYVTNLGANTVTVYAKGKTSPSKTYSTGITEPTDVAVGKDGTVYVSEFAPGQIVEFDKGATSPSRTVSLAEVESIALDSKNNLYASYINPNTGGGGVEEYAPKKTSGKDLGIVIGAAGGLKIDKKNDLILGDQNAAIVDFFKPGSSTPYGSISANGDPFKLALNAPESLLYVATAGSTVNIFQDKPSGSQQGTVSGLQAATGVALTPAPPYDE